MTLASDALAIARAGIRAVDPRRAVGRSLVRTSRGFLVGDRPLRPERDGTLHLVAIGKAAAAMIDAAAGTAHGKVGGIAVTPRGYPAPTTAVEVVFGDHPVPRAGSFRAGAALLDYVRSVRAVDAVLFLISGGGSAVAEVPAPGLTPVEIRRATEVLLGSGAAIGEMNTIRRHVSAVKGGRLAEATAARAFATLALSDVVGDPPEDIASGPTVADPTTYRQALEVLRRHGIGGRMPPGLLRHLRDGARGRFPETPKPSDRRMRGAPFVLAASNRIALAAAESEARDRGYSARIQSSRVVGETRPVARRFARSLLRLARRSGDRPTCLLSGGETTVTLSRHSGRGGRNQEFALAAAEILDGTSALVMSIGTDGIDGPTDAAGGWADGGTRERAHARRLDLASALRDHSSYGTLARLGELVRTGPTGTNVMDLHVGLWRPDPVDRGRSASSRSSSARAVGSSRTAGAGALRPSARGSRNRAGAPPR